MKNNTTTFIVPIGTISIIQGHILPAGWALCDGSTIEQCDIPDSFEALSKILQPKKKRSNTVTVPDLRDRFIVGVSKELTPLHSGGPGTHIHDVPTQTSTFTSTKAGDHSHNFPSGWYNNNTTSGGRSSINPGSTFSSSSKGEHEHSITINTDGTATSTPNGAWLNRPNHIPLNYMIKIS